MKKLAIDIYGDDEINLVDFCKQNNTIEKLYFCNGDNFPITMGSCQAIVEYCTRLESLVIGCPRSKKAICNRYLIDLLLKH